MSFAIAGSITTTKVSEYPISQEIGQKLLDKSATSTLTYKHTTRTVTMTVDYNDANLEEESKKNDLPIIKVTKAEDDGADSYTLIGDELMWNNRFRARALADGIANFIPHIVYAMRPETAYAAALHYIAREIGGLDEYPDQQRFILQNPGINHLLVDFWDRVQEITWSGGFSPNITNATRTTLLLAITEALHYTITSGSGRNEESTLVPHLELSVLEHAGVYLSSIQDPENYPTANGLGLIKEANKRGNHAGIPNNLQAYLTCHVCLTTKETPEELRTHQQEPGCRRSITCDSCGLKFNTSEGYRIHAYTFCKQGPLPSGTCPTCGTKGPKCLCHTHWQRTYSLVASFFEGTHSRGDWLTLHKKAPTILLAANVFAEVPLGMEETDHVTKDTKPVALPGTLWTPKHVDIPTKDPASLEPAIAVGDASLTLTALTELVSDAINIKIQYLEYPYDKIRDTPTVLGNRAKNARRNILLKGKTGGIDADDKATTEEYEKVCAAITELQHRAETSSPAMSAMRKLQTGVEMEDMEAKLDELAALKLEMEKVLFDEDDEDRHTGQNDTDEEEDEEDDVRAKETQDLISRQQDALDNFRAIKDGLKQRGMSEAILKAHWGEGTQTGATIRETKPAVRFDPGIDFTKKINEGLSNMIKINEKIQAVAAQAEEAKLRFEKTQEEHKAAAATKNPKTAILEAKMRMQRAEAEKTAQKVEKTMKESMGEMASLQSAMDRNSKSMRTSEGKKKTRYTCKNEKHATETPPYREFLDLQSKTAHLAREHKCLYYKDSPPCHFYFEMDAELGRHLLEKHPIQEAPNTCDICGARVAEVHMDQHKRVLHSQCESCEAWFAGIPELKEHYMLGGGRCTDTPAVRSKTPPPTPITVPNSTTLASLPNLEGGHEGYLTEAFSLLVDNAMPGAKAEVKSRCKDLMGKYAFTERHIATINKNPWVAQSQTTLFLTPPCFKHPTSVKERSMDKVLEQAKVTNLSPFVARHFDNFLLADALNLKITQYTTQFYLIESSAVYMLVQHLSQSNQDTLRATYKRRVHELSYKEILSCLQKKYYNFDLRTLRDGVAGLKRGQNEHMIEFYNRVYKLATLAALNFQPDEKEKWVEQKTREIFYKGLDNSLKLEIDAIESKDGSQMTSTQLLETYICRQNLKAPPMNLDETLLNVARVKEYTPPPPRRKRVNMITSYGDVNAPSNNQTGGAPNPGHPNPPAPQKGTTPESTGPRDTQPRTPREQLKNGLKPRPAPGSANTRTPRAPPRQPNQTRPTTNNSSERRREPNRQSDPRQRLARAPSPRPRNPSFLTGANRTPRGRAPGTYASGNPSWGGTRPKARPVIKDATLEIMKKLDLTTESITELGIHCFQCGAGRKDISNKKFHRITDCPLPRWEGQPHSCNRNTKLLHHPRDCTVNPKRVSRVRVED